MGIVPRGTFKMIAKPKHSESQIRFQISELEKMIGITPNWMQSPIHDQIERLNNRLSQWKAWRREVFLNRALHQRPSVRRHITRRVKTPA